MASVDDVKAALRRDLAADDLLYLDDLLQEASDLVTGYLYPSEVPTPTPGPISRVVAAMAAVVLTRPSQILPETQSLQADGFGVTFTPGGNTPGPYLTLALKARLRPYQGGTTSVLMEGDRY
jgi:hypothetical protein